MATYDVDSLDITKGSDTYRIHADRIKSYATSSDFPQTGAEGYLYIAEDESALYRWNGTGYSSVSSSTPLFKIPFTISVSEWVSESGSYTADIINANITADSIEFVVYNASIKTSLISNIETQKNSSNTGISFIVTAKPLGSVSGTIYCLSPRDGGRVPVEIIQGVLPISRGGTGASTAAGAQANLGLTVANNTTTTDSGSVLDARQGKILNDKIADLNSNLGIVEDADTATHTIIKGQYVIWKGKLHTADTAIAVGTTLAASGGSKNLTYKENGGLNDLENYPRLATDGEDFVFTRFSENVTYEAGQHIMLSEHIMYAMEQYTMVQDLPKGTWNIFTINEVEGDTGSRWSGIAYASDRGDGEIFEAYFGSGRLRITVPETKTSVLKAGGILRITALLFKNPQ